MMSDYVRAAGRGYVADLGKVATRFMIYVVMGSTHKGAIYVYFICIALYIYIYPIYIYIICYFLPWLFIC